jgi:hypothetical protein
MSIYVTVDTHGLTADTLSVRIDPGVTAGVFVSPIPNAPYDPSAFCPAGSGGGCPVYGHLAFAPYVEVLERQTRDWTRMEPILGDANTGHWTVDYSARRVVSESTGHHIGAQKLGYNLTVLRPGKVQCPFHNHHGEEEMFFILDGSSELRSVTKNILCDSTTSSPAQPAGRRLRTKS